MPKSTLGPRGTPQSLVDWARARAAQHNTGMVKDALLLTGSTNIPRAFVEEAVFTSYVPPG